MIMFIAGLFIGSFAGIMLMVLLATAKKGDEIGSKLCR